MSGYGKEETAKLRSNVEDQVSGEERDAEKELEEEEGEVGR